MAAGQQREVVVSPQIYELVLDSKNPAQLTPRRHDRAAIAGSSPLYGSSTIREEFRPPAIRADSPAFQYAGNRYGMSAKTADGAGRVELRRFLAVIHATGTVPARRRAQIIESDRSRAGTLSTLCTSLSRSKISIC